MRVVSIFSSHSQKESHTKPDLIPEQTYCLRGEMEEGGGTRESNLWSVCLQERGKKQSEGWIDVGSEGGVDRVGRIDEVKAKEGVKKQEG
ncbi:hypothetical protein PAMP_014448 [Pampus punctatissimus]